MSDKERGDGGIARFLKWLNFKERGRREVLDKLSAISHNADRWLCHHSKDGAATARWINKEVHRYYGSLDWIPGDHADISDFRRLLLDGKADDCEGKIVDYPGAFDELLAARESK